MGKLIFLIMLNHLSMNGKYNMHEWGINIHKRVKAKISMNGNTISMNG